MDHNLARHLKPFVMWRQTVFLVLLSRGPSGEAGLAAPASETGAAVNRMLTGRSLVIPGGWPHRSIEGDRIDVGSAEHLACRTRSCP